MRAFASTKNPFVHQGSHWALTQVVQPRLQPAGSLQGKTILITGASRGIGLAIAKRAAQDHANIALLAKTTEPHPKLPGTIYTAAKEVEEAGGRALPLVCDVRSEEQVARAVEQTVQRFGGIDVLVNNASALGMTGTLDTDMKRYDLMQQVNTRGTFVSSKLCIPHLLRAANPHILCLSPPLNLNPHWFGPHLAYTIAKYGMSMCVLGLSQEFQGRIAVNALWPRTAIATSAVEFALGGAEVSKRCRRPEIVSDAAYKILTSAKEATGNFFIDDEVLGAMDLAKYSVDPKVPVEGLMPDFFL